jgi:hypothetical protein
MIVYPSTSSSAPLLNLGLPAISFHGPNEQLQVHATANGQSVAQFIVHGSRSAYTVARLHGQHLQPELVCQATRSSSGSGTTTMIIHGQEVKLVPGYELELRLPNMKLKFVTRDHGDIELRDSGSVVVARGITEMTKLDVFQQMDEVALDILLSAWVAVLFKKQQDKKDGNHMAAGLEILANVLGGGGL